MRTAFTRMKPDSKNMVTEPGLTIKSPRGYQTFTLAILCVECGWEGTVVAPEAPWVIFMDHPCRLITESEATGW